jgi:hypothetical protein
MTNYKDCCSLCYYNVVQLCALRCIHLVVTGSCCHANDAYYMSLIVFSYVKQQCLPWHSSSRLNCRYQKSQRLACRSETTHTVDEQPSVQSQYVHVLHVTASYSNDLMGSSIACMLLQRAYCSNAARFNKLEQFSLAAYLCQS